MKHKSKPFSPSRAIELSALLRRDPSRQLDSVTRRLTSLEIAGLLDAAIATITHERPNAAIDEATGPLLEALQNVSRISRFQQRRAINMEQIGLTARNAISAHRNRGNT